MLKAQIVGNLGKDAEVKTLPSGQRYYSFSVAHTFRTQQGDQTVWVNCTKWIRQGDSEAVFQYMKKGKKVYLEGTPSARAWAAQDGTANASLELNVAYIELLSPNDQAQPQAAAPAQQQWQQPATAQQPNYTMNANGMQAQQPAPAQQQAPPAQQQAAPPTQAAAPAANNPWTAQTAGQWGAAQNPNDPIF